MLSLQNIGHNNVPEESFGIDEAAGNAADDVNDKKRTSEKIKIRKTPRKTFCRNHNTKNDSDPN